MAKISLKDKKNDIIRVKSPYYILKLGLSIINRIKITSKGNVQNNFFI